MNMDRDDFYAEVDDNAYWWHHKFDNGYGASVVSNPNSYGWDIGLFEVAVTHSGHLCYLTSVTNDVLGWQTHAQVAEVLETLKALPINDYCIHRRVRMRPAHKAKAGS